jgi:hypothetical protein
VLDSGVLGLPILLRSTETGALDDWRKRSQSSADFAKQTVRQVVDRNPPRHAGSGSPCVIQPRRPGLEHWTGCATRIGRVDWSSARPTVGVFRCLAACAASVAQARCQVAAEAIMPATTILLPFQPDAMTPAQLAAVSYLARYSGPYPRVVRLPAASLVRLVRGQRVGRPDRRAAGPRGAVHPAPAGLRAKGLFDLHDDAWRPRVLPVCPHRRPHPRRPRGVRPVAQDPLR